MKALGTDKSDFIRYPTNRVVGTVADAAKAGAAIDALLRAGFDRQDIDILHDAEDLHRLDPTGAGHGFLAQFQRTLIRTFELEEFKHLQHYVEDVREGRFVIMVLTKRRGQRLVAADILHEFGSEYVGFYGRWACEELPSTAQTSPEAIPLLFARTAFKCPSIFMAGYVSARAVSLDALSTELEPVVGRPVLNRTGLTGEFDIDLSYSPGLEAATAGTDLAPQLATALRDQLGLRLAARRRAVDVLVIDRATMPSEN